VRASLPGSALGGFRVVSPYYQRGPVTLYLGDCRDVLPTLTERGHVITDPPYSEHTHTKSRAGSRKLASGSGYEKDPSAYKTATISREVDFGFDHLSAPLRRFVARQAARLASRWVLVFSDVESASLWRWSLMATGLEYVRTGEWRKERATPQFTGDRPGVAFEVITIAHPKGKKRWNGGGKGGAWSAPVVQERAGTTGGEPRIHTTQKPEQLLRDLVADFTDPGDLVYDPFAGSGTTGIACARLGRRCILIEREEKWAEAARKRIDAELDGSTYHAAQRGQVPMFGGSR
jgi:hypothetical protein